MYILNESFAIVLMFSTKIANTFGKNSAEAYKSAYISSLKMKFIKHSLFLTK